MNLERRSQRIRHSVSLRQAWRKFSWTDWNRTHSQVSSPLLQGYQWGEVGSLPSTLPTTSPDRWFRGSDTGLSLTGGPPKSRSGEDDLWLRRLFVERSTSHQGASRQTPRKMGQRGRCLRSGCGWEAKMEVPEGRAM